MKAASLRIFASFADAERAEREEYRAMTPAERLELVSQLRAFQHGPDDATAPDWKEFLKLLNSQEVEYIIVGAHALALHGIPRYTRDIDVFVRISETNARRLESSLREFGFASLHLTAEDFLKPGMILQLGVEPYRIDVITSITGVEFDEAWCNRKTGQLDGVSVSFLSAGDFRKNKLATGRTKDLADVEALLDAE